MSIKGLTILVKMYIRLVAVVFNRMFRLLNVFFGKIIQYTYAHFLPVRSGKMLDGSAVESRTQPFFRVQAHTLHSGIFLHPISLPGNRMPERIPLYNRKYL